MNTIISTWLSHQGNTIQMNYRMKMQKSEEEKVFIGIDNVGVAACHVYQFYPYKTQNSKRIRFLEVWGFESDIEMC